MKSKTTDPPTLLNTPTLLARYTLACPPQCHSSEHAHTPNTSIDQFMHVHWSSARMNALHPGKVLCDIYCKLRVSKISCRPTDPRFAFQSRPSLRCSLVHLFSLPTTPRPATSFRPKAEARPTRRVASKQRLGDWDGHKIEV
jgi:hypothetical protein